MKYFKGKGGELEHIALIVLWLSRYVFSTNSYNVISQNVFTLAINLATGVKLALAPAVLAAIYRDLRLLKQKIVSFTCEGDYQCSDLVVWALFQLVQIWAWERFPCLGPEPASLIRGEPRVARWHNIKKQGIENMKEEIESIAADQFYWKPYAALSVQNWKFPKLYSDQGMLVALNSEVDEHIRSFARCLRCCELVGVDCVEQYLPHRVGMQFGYDQDIPNCVPRLNANLELAWSSYCKTLDGLKLYSPPRLFEGDFTVQYSNWWSEKVIGPQENDEAEEYEHGAMEEEEENKLDHSVMKKGNCTHKGVLPCSLPKCNKARICDFVGRSNVVINENSSPPCSLISAQNLLQRTIGVDQNDLMNKDRAKKFKESNVSKNETACCALVEDEQGAAVKQANTKQMGTQNEDLVIISDTEDDVCTPFEAIGLEFEARISRFERAISTVKAAKLGSKGV